MEQAKQKPSPQAGQSQTEKKIWTPEELFQGYQSGGEAKLKWMLLENQPYKTGKE
jgi:hypothetical protein